jgi:hypothetical protein
MLFRESEVIDWNDWIMIHNWIQQRWYSSCIISSYNSFRKWQNSEGTSICICSFLKQNIFWIKVRNLQKTVEMLESIVIFGYFNEINILK